MTWEEFENRVSTIKEIMGENFLSKEDIKLIWTCIKDTDLKKYQYTCSACGLSGVVNVTDREANEFYSKYKVLNDHTKTNRCKCLMGRFFGFPLKEVEPLKSSYKGSVDFGIRHITRGMVEKL